MNNACPNKKKKCVYVYTQTHKNVCKHTYIQTHTERERERRCSIMKICLLKPQKQKSLTNSDSLLPIGSCFHSQRSCLSCQPYLALWASPLPTENLSTFPLMPLSAKTHDHPSNQGLGHQLSPPRERKSPSGGA